MINILVFIFKFLFKENIYSRQEHNNLLIKVLYKKLRDGLGVSFGVLAFEIEKKSFSTLNFIPKTS